MKKQTFLFTLVMVFCCLTFCFSQTTQHSQQTVVNTGFGLGTVIAVALSWAKNKSILWAIIHGILGWIYVIYYALTR